MIQVAAKSTDVKSDTNSNGEGGSSRYYIEQTDSGLQISESRVLLFDVMEAYNEGDSIYQICDTFNLTPRQVKVAIKYIDEHRTELEPKFARAVQQRQEREAYYRALAEEHMKKKKPSPITPERAAVYALLEKIRQERGEMNASDPL